MNSDNDDNDKRDTSGVDVYVRRLEGGLTYLILNTEAAHEWLEVVVGVEGTHFLCGLVIKGRQLIEDMACDGLNVIQV